MVFPQGEVSLWKEVQSRVESSYADSGYVSMEYFHLDQGSRLQGRKCYNPAEDKI